MECDICGRPAPSKVRLFCPTCARNRLYRPRTEYAIALLEKEIMARRVEAAVEEGDHQLPRESLSLSGKIIDTHDCARSAEMDRTLSESSRLNGRIQIIANGAQSLRSEMEQYRKQIQARKAAAQQRKSDSESANFGLADREAKEIEDVEASIRRTKRRWEQVHKEIVSDRLALCKPAAKLAGLQRHRKIRDDGVMREYYSIGSGLPVFDLRELHGPSSPISFFMRY